MKKVTIDHVNFRGSRVLVRADFNVPLDKDGNITDDRRIREALPTIKKITHDGGRVILCSHLGRPREGFAPEFSLFPVCKRLSKLLAKNVLFAEDCIGPEASNVVAKMKDGDVCLLENVRFHAGEERNDRQFSQKLASLADIFVNDAFGSAHRAHASTAGVTEFFDQSVAGYLMEKELAYLGRAVSNPKRPFAAILGGAKISGKIDVITSLMDKVDHLLIGGGMVFTFVKAMGHEVGDSLVEKDKISVAADIIDRFKRSSAKLHFPSDIIIADEVSENAKTTIVPLEKIPVGKKGLDIGPESINSFRTVLSECQTIVWNGPMGVFELKPFSEGTLAVARILAERTQAGAITVIGGGDSAAAIAQAGLEDKVTHVSTGGGASLEFLEGKLLPGVAALTDLRSVNAV